MSVPRRGILSDVPNKVQPDTIHIAPYDDSALDTGGGLRPELTGQGLGRTVISAGLAFGRARFAPASFRVTVASFNARALHTVASLGFQRVGSFKASRDARDFDVLVRAETTPNRTPTKADWARLSQRWREPG